MMESVPGEVAELDFRCLGYISDREAGRRCTVWALIVVLAYSKRSFARPTFSQKLGDVIDGLEAAWAFCGTNLKAWYVSKGVDMVIVTGCTTSGCIRASVIDSMSYNFRTVVAIDCVGDRALGPHEADLFDMRQKYADLLTSSEIMAVLYERVTIETAARPQWFEEADSCCLNQSKPKPQWDVHLRDSGNRARRPAVAPGPLIAGRFGSGA